MMSSQKFAKRGDVKLTIKREGWKNGGTPDFYTLFNKKLI